MDTTNPSDPLQQLNAAKKTAIADLGPELLEPESHAVRGVVTITWPYNSVKGTFAFILAEPDYRLRRSKGQVRINLTGVSAKAAGESGLSSTDEVLLSLDGAEWEPEQVKRQSLPGAGIDWQLMFSDKLLLQVTLAETKETKLVAVSHPPPAEPQPRAETPPIETVHVHDEDPPTERLETLTPPSKTHIARLKDGEFESPVFIKRARMSYGSLFEDGYDIFEDDGGVKGRGRKRSRFGRESGAWKYTSQSPSPEPASPQKDTSSPPRPEMADEGCQTMELDFPIPSSMHTDVDIEAAPRSPKPIPVEEHATHSRQGMVDHGVQDNFHSGWPTTASTPLLPFDPSTGLSSNGSELSGFQHANQFHTVDNSFQHGWDPRSMDISSVGYPHSIEQPLPNDFVDDYGGERSVGPRGIRSGSHTRSPSEPNSLAIETAEHDLNGDLPTDEHNYPPRALPHSTPYPPLDLENDEHTSSNPGARLDYPASYLEDSRPFSQEAMDVETDTFGPRVTEMADPGSSIWTTINPPQETAMPQSDRLGSTEGESVDNAVVIDESDSDDGPPPPTAVEDTTIKGRDDGLDMYGEDEVEGEVNAEYSDDDEPEYEVDEMGDYDTRNYTAPDDDEDDSHDEDLRSHNLEPEFDDGRSWGEEDENEDEDEDEENSDYDSEYEMDENGEEPRQQPQPIPQSTPQIIDLISSSEDEGEDEEVSQPQPQPPSRIIHEGTPRNPPEITPNEMPSKAVTQDVQSGSEEDDGDEPDELSNNEDEEEGGERQSDAISTDTSDNSDFETSGIEDEGMQESFEEKREVAAESSGDEDVVVSPDVETQQKPPVLETSPVNSSTIDQERSLQPKRAESITIQERDGDDIMKYSGIEEEEVNIPKSAAEGLEILSRAVECESNANNGITGLEKVQSDVVDSPSPEAHEPLISHAQDLEKKKEPESQDTHEEEEPVDMVPTLPSATSNLQSIVIDEDKRFESIVPSSPPLTHSFISQPADDGRMDIVMQEADTITESQAQANQLPTPRDTQPVADLAISESSAAVLMEVDVPDENNNTAESAETAIQEISSATEKLINTKESSDPVENAIVPVEAQPVEPTTLPQQQTPLEEGSGEITAPNHVLVSPTLSFQTQIVGDDIMQGSFIQSSPNAMIESKAESDIYSDVEVDASVANLSFVSQMEVDEELQASILEYSWEFDESADIETSREHGISNQLENFEDESDLIQNEDETRTESEAQHLASRGSSPDLGTQMQERRESTRAISIDEQTDISEQTSQMDPSVQLARAANASKRHVKQHDAAKNLHADEKKLVRVKNSTPASEDSSVQLARALLDRPEEESNSMTAAKLELHRHLRDYLPDCTSLKVLRQHLRGKLDVIAVAMMQPPDPQRAKGGPREFMMSFTITDHSIGPYSVVEVQLYRPHKETLPIVKAGDVVFLQKFTVVSLQNKGFGLRTNDESSWAIFDHDNELAQIKGPPVEYDEKETIYVAHLRAWFNLLDEKARAKLEKANKKIINAGRS
ncbi:hypothetical protein F4804DRAFT_309853, partial [Jackrogersella minutella]